MGSQAIEDWARETPRLDRVAAESFEVLRHIPVLPRRLSLETPGVRAHVPMLRGVWGAALHDGAPASYAALFEGRGAEGGGEPHPAYVLRPAAPDPADSPAVDWLLLGPGVDHDAAALAAWTEASRRGLGPRRVAFRIRGQRVLGPDGVAGGEGCTAWTLDRAAWPLAGDPPVTPCRLRFPAPLRLLRRKRLIEAPTLPDIIVGICRRVSAFAPPVQAEKARTLSRAATALARARPAASWQGDRLDLQRYSGTQKGEVEMHGVAGHLDLPEGPGSLWPLLAAAQWLHLGKGTVFGLGQLHIETIPS